MKIWNCFELSFEYNAAVNQILTLHKIVLEIQTSINQTQITNNSIDVQYDITDMVCIIKDIVQI